MVVVMEASFAAELFVAAGLSRLLIVVRRGFRRRNNVLALLA
jgi:hypothetical protein